MVNDADGIPYRAIPYAGTTVTDSAFVRALPGDIIWPEALTKNVKREVTAIPMILRSNLDIWPGNLMSCFAIGTFTD
jgi:hypothetical protein